MDMFEKFPKITRLYSPVCITEKIDGTNAQIYIGSDGEFVVGSRNRIITPDSDNYGFARWAYDHAEELLHLGPGRHFGEWWGNGIQRNYGMKEKVFSLFNVHRWNDDNPPPPCCRVVPVLFRGEMTHSITLACETRLRIEGSKASPGFMNPEGLMVYYENNGVYFKHPFGK